MGYLKNETREEYNSRYNKLMKQRYYDRRAKAIEMLGGKCVDCGTTEQLEFDHVDENKKLFVVTQKLVSGAWDKLTEEINKCVLRCQSCHAYHTAFQKLKAFDALSYAGRL